MTAPAWDTRFFESTKGRIVDLLRQGVDTVDELAARLELTDNAVRLHLATLERDGVVRASGVRRGGGVGKPATLYEITPAAEPTFSRAYLPLLSALLEALGDRLGVRELRALMRDVGRRLGAGQPGVEGDARARAELASQVLNSLGGLTRVEAAPDGTARVRGCGCPLSVAVEKREEVCVAVQTMLREVTGSEVKEHCDRSGKPQCQFIVPAD